MRHKPLTRFAASIAIAALGLAGAAGPAAASGFIFEFQPMSATSWKSTFSRSTSGTYCDIAVPTSGRKIGAGSPDVGYVANWDNSSILWGRNVTVRPGCYNPHSVALTAVDGVWFSPAVPARVSDSGPTTAAVTDALPALKRQTSPAKVRESWPVQRSVTRLAGQAIANADWSVAKSVPAGRLHRAAWLVPAGGQVCVVTPLAAEAYGSTCHPAGSLTGAVTLSVAIETATSRPTTGLAVLVVPSGVAAPKVRHIDGSFDTLTVTDNLAQATVAETDTIEVDGTQIAAAGYFPR